LPLQKQYPFEKKRLFSISFAIKIIKNHNKNFILSRDVLSSRLRSSLPQSTTSALSLSQSLSQGSRQNSAKRISFSSLSTPKDSVEAYFANRFFQLSRPGLNENSRLNKRKARSAKIELPTSSFYESECNASEIGKADIHEKIIG
jgi:hypothetical protein